MKKEMHASEKRALRLIFCGVVLYAAATNLSSVWSGVQWALGLFSPVVLGLSLALILNVPMRGCEKLISKLDRKSRLSPKLERALSLILTVIIVPVILVLMVNFILPQFINAIKNVVTIVLANEAEIVAFISKIGLDPALIEKLIGEIIDWVNGNIPTIAATTVSTAISTLSSVTTILLSIILAIYVLLDKRNLSLRMQRLLRALLPDKAAKFTVRCGSMFVSTFSTYLGRQCLEALILGVLLSILMLIFRLPYVVTIACMTAILALIPYVGAYISLFTGTVLVFTESPMKALIFIIIFLVAQQVEGNIIYPRVVGKSVGLPAYITLSAVVVGGALAGIPGMFFIIPVVSVAYVLLEEYVNKRNAEKDALAATPPASDPHDE